MMLSTALFGRSEWSLRLPSVLAAVVVLAARATVTGSSIPSSSRTTSSAS